MILNFQKKKLNQIDKNKLINNSECSAKVVLSRYLIFCIFCTIFDFWNYKSSWRHCNWNFDNKSRKFRRLRSAYSENHGFRPIYSIWYTTFWDLSEFLNICLDETAPTRGFYVWYDKKVYKIRLLIFWKDGLNAFKHALKDMRPTTIFEDVSINGLF